MLEKKEKRSSFENKRGCVKQIERYVLIFLGKAYLRIGETV
jgi:hypothetical protein